MTRDINWEKRPKTETNQTKEPTVHQVFPYINQAH